MIIASGPAHIIIPGQEITDMKNLYDNIVGTIKLMVAGVISLNRSKNTRWNTGPGINLNRIQAITLQHFEDWRLLFNDWMSQTQLPPYALALLSSYGLYEDLIKDGSIVPCLPVEITDHIGGFNEIVELEK